MTRRLAYPFACAGVLGLWLMLNQTLALKHIVLGSLVALVSGLALGVLEAPTMRMRQLRAVLLLLALVLADIARSNIAVARIVLGIGTHRHRSGFVDIPLDLRNPYALAALACIITATPGSLWVHFDEATRTLTIHVLDLIDESDWLRTIKGRYERLLLEILP